MAETPKFSPDGTYVLDDDTVSSMESESLTAIVRKIEKLPDDEPQDNDRSNEDLAETPIQVDDSFVDYEK
jgi:hypothetical protein